MKKIILILVILFSCSTNSQEKKEKTEIKVYICNSMASKAYHYNKNCTGLVKCKDTIIKITLRKAERYGRVCCKYEKQ